jgi:hypothetical protein
MQISVRTRAHNSLFDTSLRRTTFWCTTFFFQHFIKQLVLSVPIILSWGISVVCTNNIK